MLFLPPSFQEGKKCADGGTRLLFVTGAVTSPSLRHQLRRISDRYPNARWIVHEPACDLGKPRALPALERADVPFLDADFSPGGRGCWQTPERSRSGVRQETP